MKAAGPDLLRPGEEVGGYRIEAFLGQGALAAVYGAVHIKERTRHCLKLLTSGSEEIFSALKREAGVLETLRHPNIVHVRGIVHSRSGPALLMEPIDGCSLAVLLENTTLSEYEAVGIATQMLRGLEVAHEAGIHHRDLKPSNVLLAADEYETNAKLTDFGIYNIIMAHGRDGTDRTGVTFGTPAYMAPEQLTNTEENYVATDLYSVGAILYHMLCGRPPYDGKNLMQIVKQRASGVYPDPKSINDSISDGMVTLLDDLLSTDPGNRPVDAREVLRRLGQSIVPKAINGPLKDRVRETAANRRGEAPKWPPDPNMSTPAPAQRQGTPAGPPPVARPQQAIMPPTGELPQGAARVRVDDPTLITATTENTMAVPVAIGCFTLALVLGALAAGIAAGLQ